MKKIFLLLFSVVFYFTLQAQNTHKSYQDTLSDQSVLEPINDTIPDINLFGEEEPLNITIKYDISSFIKNKKEGEYMDAIFQVHYKNQTVTKNIRLKARGNFRRGQCFFPPIYLNFKTDPFENDELENIKKIKLVTHCSSSKLSEEYILNEYLAYKIYNQLTPFSFGVRLLKIEYIDTGKKAKNYENYGFLIEPEELLAKRTNSVKIDAQLMQEENVVEADADRVALFQYMIGNTDWRFKGGHNTKCVKSLSEIENKVIPVPYDFDFSGFVGTNYSFPQSWTSIKDVRDREYLGYCRNSDQEYINNVNLFNLKKEDVLNVIKNSPFLDEKVKKSDMKFLEGFYSAIAQPERFVKVLKSQCRDDASMKQEQ